jgi:hypothetical protein
VGLEREKNMGRPSGNQEGDQEGGKSWQGREGDAGGRREARRRRRGGGGEGEEGKGEGGR